MRHTSISIAYLLCHITLALPQQPLDSGKLIERAVSGDKTVFADSYMAEKFSKWQSRFRLETFKIDTVIADQMNGEIWLSKAGLPDGWNHAITLHMARAPRPKISDVKRLLSTRRSFGPAELALVELVERFAWLYEIGVDGFLLDFLYPGHVKARYDGLDEEREIISKLRTRFERVLPIQAVEWEGRVREFDISLILDSPLRPLQFKVDVQEYLTAYFFDIGDRSERAHALADSINTWLAGGEMPVGKQATVEAASESEALEKFIGVQFKEYNVSILSRSQNQVRMEATLPAIHGISPDPFRLRIAARERARGNVYPIEIEWLPTENLERGLSVFSDVANTMTAQAVDQTLHRYQGLGLPPLLESRASRQALQVDLSLNARQVSHFDLHNQSDYVSVLQGLAKDKLVYFFTRSVVEKKDSVIVTGYLLLRDRERLWHHLVKIREGFSRDGREQVFTTASVDLFPYIRVENVRALFALEEERGAMRGTVKVKR